MARIDSRLANIDFYASNESYTLDKSKIYLCLRDKHGKLYDYNFLIYVCLHESAHVLSTKYDERHITREFNETFAYLKERARQMGIWDEKKELISDYCNYHLKNN